MKPVLMFALIFLSSLVYGQVEWPPVGEEGKDYFLNSKEKPDGLHYRTYQDGSLFYYGYFENGIPKANTEFWYYYEKPSGVPMTLHKIQEDPKSIEAVNYFTKGKVMSTGFYYNQKKTGEWKFYNEDGVLTSSETYTEDILDGPSTVYYENGEVFRVTSFENGIKNGSITEYFDNGKKKMEGYFVNDKRHGEITYYLPSGRLDITGKFKNGLKDGSWTKFATNGKPELTTLYREDQKIKERRDNGVFMDYYSNGIPKAEYEYENSKKNGPFTVWFNKGEWIKEEMKVDEGGGMSYKEKLIGTQIQREGDYLDDLLEGEVTYYDENGKITHVETYEAGVLISTDKE